MIKNIVFDMGNVLMVFDPAMFIDRYPELSEEDKKLLAKEIFLNPEWDELDRGKYDQDEDYAAVVKARLPEKYHYYVDELVCRWFEPVVPMEGTEEIVKALKEKGYKLYLLSNAGPSQDEYWENIPAKKYFDGKVISSHEKEWKPNNRIYQILFERFNIDPKESVFIDDNSDNIKASIGLGMDGILFKGPGALIEELKKRSLL